MAKRTSFLIRIDPGLLDDLKRWADAEFRSTNAQIEFLLRKCLVEAGRLKREKNTESTTGDDCNDDANVDADDWGRGGNASKESDPIKNSEPNGESSARPKQT